MILFWSLAATLAAVLALWIAWPFLRRGQIEMNDADSTISVFRDQIDEIDNDLAQGLISAAEREAAQREIEARALAAARQIDGGMSVSQRSWPMAAGVAVLAMAVALGGYALTGVPKAPDRPLAARKTDILERRAAAGDNNARIGLLIEKTGENPRSFEDWWTLATSHSAVGNHAAAVEAYRRAVELGGDKPGVMSAYGEAMVLANGNKVPQAARVIFETVLRNGPDVRARYYIALARAQAQDFEGAMAGWVALARDSQPDAPWMPLVRRDIVNMARFMKIDVTSVLPDATAAEIAKAGGTAASPGAAQRAEALETALASDAHDYKGWIELATIRAWQGDNDAAAAALDAAREAYAAAPFVLGKIDETARALGLDMIAEAAPGTGGPTGEDMAAAAGMTQEERDEMVDGMVAGLAAKLEENPDNPDGWIMLVRSYLVLGNEAKARENYDLAVGYFAGNAPVLARLDAEAGNLLTE